MTRLVPGLTLCAAMTAVLLGARPLLGAVPAVSPLLLALVAGAAVATLAFRGDQGRRRAARTEPGGAWVARHVLRAGIVLLGLQLSFSDVLGLGWRGLTIVTVTVTVTFAATLAVGRLLRLPRATTLLVATGFSICGAAAVAAMAGVLERRVPPEQGLRDAVAAALALVTVYGTLAVVTLPWLAPRLGLDAWQSGLWIGASVQEVAQVIAAAGAVSGVALAAATVAKLSRVVLLAPLVAVAGLLANRRAAPVAPAAPGGRPRRPAPVPGFVLGFLGAMGLRSLDVVPAAVLEAASHVTTAAFVAALVALGLGVDLPRLVRTGGRVLVLGAASALVVTGVALAGVVLLTG